MKKKLLVTLALVSMCSTFMFSACKSEQSSSSDSSSGNSNDISVSDGSVSEDLESITSSITSSDVESSDSSNTSEDSESTLPDPTPEVTNNYTVKFYNGDTLAKEETVKDGSAATAPVVTKDATEYVTYTFEKWVDVNGVDVDLSNITSNMEVYAKYSETLTKAGVNALLQMDSEESVGLFTSDWPTTYIPTLTENGVTTVVEFVGDGGVCKTTIDLKSVYQVKDISSITISYYILSDNNGWQNTSLYVNGVDCKDLGYINDGQGTNLRTITITKGALIAAGLTAETYIENCALVPYNNYGPRTFCIAGIEFNEQGEETINYTVKFYNGDILVKEETVEDGAVATAPVVTKDATEYVTYTFEKWVDVNGADVNLNNVFSDMEVYAKYSEALTKAGVDVLLQMNSEEAVGLFTSDWPTTYIPTLTENGVTTIVELAGDGTACKTTIDLKSVYQLKDVSTITISYYILADNNGWQNTSLYVNGVDCKDLGYINDGKGTNLRKIKITKEELETIGLTEESYIETCALVPYNNYGARTFCIAGIVFNAQDEEPSTYTVKFYNGDTLVKEEMVVNGGAATAPEVAKDATEYATYTFEKWVDFNGADVDLSNVISDMEVYAKYSEILTKAGVNALLQMDNESSVGLFRSDWQSSVDYVPAWNEEAGVTLKLVSGGYGTCNVTMNMYSLYSVAEVGSITIVYTLNVGDGNNGWAETQLAVNGQYIKNMGHVAHDEWGMNAPQTQERTLTVTKADLLATGLTETDALASFVFSQTGNGIGFITIKNITIAEYVEVSPEEALNALLQMGSQESAGLFTSDWQSSPDYVPVWAEETGVTFKLVSGNYGTCNVAMNMGTVYSVADVESITIVYSLNVVNGNGWAETQLAVNGQYIKNMGHVAHDEWGMNAAQTQERTLTITKAELLAAGLTETDVLTSFAFSQTDNGIGLVTIKNIIVA